MKYLAEWIVFPTMVTEKGDVGQNVSYNTESKDKVDKMSFFTELQLYNLQTQIISRPRFGLSSAASPAQDMPFITELTACFHCVQKKINFTLLQIIELPSSN